MTEVKTPLGLMTGYYINDKNEVIDKKNRIVPKLISHNPDRVQLVLYTVEGKQRLVQYARFIMANKLSLDYSDRRWLVDFLDGNPLNCDENNIMLGTPQNRNIKRQCVYNNSLLKQILVARKQKSRIEDIAKYHGLHKNQIVNITRKWYLFNDEVKRKAPCTYMKKQELLKIKVYL